MTRSSAARARWRGRLRRLRRRLFIGSFARDTNYSLEFNDWGHDHLDDRIIRLEEIIAARWPRSTVLRRRLARELRASAAKVDSDTEGFRMRRAEAASLELSWLMEQRDRRADLEGRHPGE